MSRIGVMAADPRAGQPAQAEDLIDVAHVSLDGAFNEAHIVATTQAIADYRAALVHEAASEMVSKVIT